MEIAYATVEQVADALEIAYKSYSKARILPKLYAGARAIEGLLHRRFYPEKRTIRIDWPNWSSSPAWELRLGDNELASVTQILSGDGSNITSNVFLRRDDDKDEPPYTRLEVDLSSNSVFTGGTTWQRSITITGVFTGDKDTSTTLSGAVLSGAISSTTATSIVLNPVSGYYTPGIGSLLLIDSERLLVVNRSMSAVSGQTTSGSPLASQSATSIGVTSGTAFATGEVILIDSERMKINDIAGNNLIVERAFDGTELAAHSSGTAIYALRTFTVSRGVLGSTAATHSDAASVYVHEYPSLINELNIAETVVMLEQNTAGYNNTIGSSSNERDTPGRGKSSLRGSANYISGLADLRERALAQYGRIGRMGAI